jgi:hypothetical protein
LSVRKEEENFVVEVFGATALANRPLIFLMSE